MAAIHAGQCIDGNTPVALGTGLVVVHLYIPVERRKLAAEGVQLPQDLFHLLLGLIGLGGGI